MTTTISQTVNRPYVPEQGGGISCEFVIEPEGSDETAERHISMCVDSSGSMGYGKMRQVRDAAELVFGLLNDDDYLSIVTFDNEVEVVMDATRWGDIDREEVQERLDAVDTRGGTDIYAGVETAKKTLRELPEGNQISKRILLLSDGRDLNRKSPEFEPLAKAVADGGISIYSAGIGTNYDQDIIRTLGEHSQGRWTHVDKPVDIRSFFGDVVEEASTVVANNPRLVIDPIPGCEIAEAYRRRPQVQQVDLEYDGDSVVVRLPDLQNHENQKIVLKMDAPGHDVGTTEAIADVELQGLSETVSTAVEVSYTDDEEKLAQKQSDTFLAYRDTKIRSQLAQADSEDDLEEVKELIDETEIITEDTSVVDDLRQDVTRIEGGDEEKVRKVQENTTVVYDGSRFD
ncbi:vWA domain-containing protein [Halobiforma nitratireducens]|uniref:von Willebrand factor A n=1 Tax=Halobiforma nitratireducens JCM 10879 TaxID=1227454 RepID=M0MLE5_9EURY|nr:VWA domain-containing protein [Halobiforma nitratireducens]EMA46208.1 von Willebrand factor A [Halobiforma nitratireducens JCM 10879]